MDAYDPAKDLHRLNNVTSFAEAEKVGLASEAQRKTLAEQLEHQSVVYQNIVAKGTTAYVFHFCEEFSLMMD